MLLEKDWATEAELKAHEKTVRKDIDDMVEQIRKDPYPAPEELYTDLGTTPQHFIRGVEYKNSIHPPAI